MIVTIGGTKGGNAKTTTNVTLANLRQIKTGFPENVLVIDADTATTSATKWMSIRSSKDNLIQISVIQKSGSKDFIQVVRSLAEKYPDIFIDVGAGNISELKAALTVSDVFITPMPASQMDAFTIATVDDLVGNARIFNPKLRALLVPSLISPNNLMAGDDFTELLELTEELEHMERSKAIIKLRKAYRKAVKQGKTIFELEGKDFDQKAVNEMTNLYNEIYDRN